MGFLIAKSLVRTNGSAESDMFSIVLGDADGKEFVIATSFQVATALGAQIEAHLKLEAEAGRSHPAPAIPEGILGAQAHPMPTDRGHMVAVMIKADRSPPLFGAMHPDHARQFAAQLEGAAKPETTVN